MNVEQLIKELSKLDKNKVVILVDPDGGWCNIEKIIEKQSTIHITHEVYALFQD